MTASPPSTSRPSPAPLKAPTWLYVVAVLFVVAMMLSPKLREYVLAPEQGAPRGGVAQGPQDPSPGRESPPAAPDAGNSAETPASSPDDASRDEPAPTRDSKPGSGPLGKYRNPDSKGEQAPRDRTELPPVVTRNKPPRGGEEPAAPAGPKLGELTEIRKGVLQSTAGLVYRRGSVDGHRLDHVLEHARDNQEKPIHGVFMGGREEILAVIDEGYQIAQKRGPPTVKKEEEGDRTVYLVDMKRKIGYLGGQVGDRKNHPPCRLLRLVLEGNEVITAFPTDR